MTDRSLAELVADRRRWRDQVLVALYEASIATTGDDIDPDEILEWIGVPPAEREDVIAVLESADYVTHPYIGPRVEITPLGINAAEDLILPPAEAVATVAVLRHVEEFLTAARSAIDAGALEQVDPDVRAEVLANVETIEAQVKSPRPRTRILSASTNTIVSVLEGTASGILAGIAMNLAVRFAG
jgi:hypothetical protein